MVNREPSAEDRVYRGVRADVMAGLLIPGEPLSEGGIATQYGVSRTPARQAMRRLVHEGLATTHPSRGTVVREVTARDVAEIFELRQALEGFAVRHAGAHIDREALERLGRAYGDASTSSGGRSPEVFHWGADTELHRLIISAAHNGRMATVLDQQSLQLARLHALFWRMADRFVDASLTASRSRAADEHAELISLLLRADFATAADLLERHLQRGSDDLIGLLARIPVTRSHEDTDAGWGPPVTLRPQAADVH